MTDAAVVTADNGAGTISATLSAGTEADTLTQIQIDGSDVYQSRVEADLLPGETTTIGREGYGGD